MRRAKYLLFLLVLTAAVFGLAAVASAAVFSDTKGTKYQEAVDALSQLGIVTGYPDGTIKPGQTITRAEFCAIVARELGLSADVAPTGTQFSDVTASHWASGLISVAAGQGLVKGYPDGTFGPDNPVTYAEAITILVRMLGYGPAMDESAWPAPYLAKAAQIGVTKNVSIKPSDPAPRGDVFMMAYNSLDADVMKQTGWGTEIKYEESKAFTDTILADKLNIKRVGNEDYPARVVAAPFSDINLDKDTLRVETSYPDNQPEKDELRGGAYQCVASVNPNAYLGYEVELWVDDTTDKVVWVRVHTDATDIINDVVDEVDYDGNVVKAFKFKKSGNKYNLVRPDSTTHQGGVTAYRNCLPVARAWNSKDNDWTTVAATGVLVKDRDVSSWTGQSGDKVSDFLGRSVKAVLNDDGEIWYVEFFKGNTWIASEDADVQDEEIRGYDEEGAERTIDLSDNDRYIVEKDGKPATLGDIKKDDLFVVYPNPLFDGTDDDDIRLIRVFSTKVSGTVDNVFSEGGSIDDYYVTVGGKDYPIIGDIYEDNYYIDAWQSVSWDNNETIERLDEEKDFDDLMGQQVTLYLVGSSVRHIVTGAKAAGAGDIYVILNTAEYDSFEGVRFKVTDKNGNDVTYKANDDTEYCIGELAETNQTELRNNFEKMYFNDKDRDGVRDSDEETLWRDGGDIDDEDNWAKGESIQGPYLVKIDLNSAGEVDELHFLAKLTPDSADLQKFTVDKTEYRLRVASGYKFAGSWKVEDWASLYDLTSGVDDVSWKALQDTQDKATAGDTFTGAAYVDDDKVVAVAVVKAPGDVEVSTDLLAGVVTARTRVSDGYKFKIIVNGEEKEYTTDGEGVAQTSYIDDNEGTPEGTPGSGRSARTDHINRGDVVVFRLNGSGLISDIWELTVGGQTYQNDWNDEIVTVAGETYRMSTDVPRWLVVDKDSKAAILTLAPMDSSGKEKTVTRILPDGRKETVRFRFTVDLSMSADPDEKSYIFDYTDTTPKLVDFGNIGTGDQVQIFYFCDPKITDSGETLDRSGGDAEKDMVQIVKIVD